MDFTSALYLGMNHPTGSLPPWQSLTTGAPAALKEPPAAGRAAKAVARLQGCEAGLLYPSTLHLFWDLFGFLSRSPIAAFPDKQAYPIAGWGLQWAAKRSVPVHGFRHHSAESLLQVIRSGHLQGRRPVVVSDGWCSQCGKAAPLKAYLEVLRPYNGLLVIDDTQALGILGRHPAAGMPYGRGGGGLLPWLGVQDGNVLVGSSLAKAFGVPVAVLSGPPHFIKRLKARSLTRVHCSPPSLAAISAALHALQLNRREGDRRRRILLQRVRQFKEELLEAGIETGPGLFPVQRLTAVQGGAAKDLHLRLTQAGVQTVLSAGHKGQAQLSFLLRANHQEEEIAEAVRLIVKNLKTSRPYLSRL
ncbi:MAG: pyridoxal phosphate-dependent aminotransferase family protein [Phaeodactylibacter sp.]|nr:pyridoxal phosphate-dependent aminotransferase family protein [Phaeodactylibacter sp.]